MSARLGARRQVRSGAGASRAERAPGSSVHAALKAVSAASSIAPASAAAASPLASPRPAPQRRTAWQVALTVLTGRGCCRVPSATESAWQWVTGETSVRHIAYEAPMHSQCVARMLPNPVPQPCHTERHLQARRGRRWQRPPWADCLARQRAPPRGGRPRQRARAAAAAGRRRPPARAPRRRCWRRAAAAAPRAAPCAAAARMATML
jgi:hypothetical protein